MKLKQATDKQANAIFEEAKDWYANAPMACIFGDCKSITIRSVAEFIANQKGISLWPKKSQN